MLSALELSGFKSFADKTRFDFPDGITVVVGPNGSGKSNVVDAIKWVLGTQSAKSLRGDDMADVIFKGSAAGGRKPCNSAEATLILDNRRRSLPVDADEVHVTRRVFRSGESEYLINREPVRLKDIRDLFRGTGVGVDAYSLIEQGKIDRMLQASAKDRRMIFEEAAGISRFKTKKIETDRRLQRVEQSLTRLKDIVDEVKGRLNALQSQASKAQQFRQMKQRLSELRLELGKDESRNLLRKIESLKKSLLELHEKEVRLQESLREISLQAEKSHDELKRVVAAVEANQQQYQRSRERAAGLVGSQQALQDRLAEIDHEQELNRTRQLALNEKAELSADELSLRQAELAALESDWDVLLRDATECDTRRQALDSEYLAWQDYLRAEEAELARARHQVEQSDALLELQSSRNLATDEQLQQKEFERSELSEQILALESDRVLRREKEQSAANEVNSLEQSVATLSAIITQHRDQLRQRQESLMHHQGRMQGIQERFLLLQQLEEQQEGIGRGAKRLLEIAEHDSREPWTTVKGLVGDLIEIDVHLAPLIDVALGPTAETVVLEDGRIIDLIRDGTLNLEGRVSVLRMDRLPSRRAGEKIQLDGLRGVLGRADRLVRCQNEFTPLIHYLLGTTWLVDSLATALDLSHLRGAGLRFVTAACERIDADGTLSIGSLQTALGLVSRRSEMLAAQEEIRSFEKLIADEMIAIEEWRIELQRLEQEQRQQDEILRASTLRLSELRIATIAEDRFLEEKQESLRSIDDLINELNKERRIGSERIDQIRDDRAQADTRSERFRIAIQERQTQLSQLQQSLADEREAWTQAKVSLARHEQRLEGLRASLEQLNRDARDRHLAVQELEQTIASLMQKRLQTVGSIEQTEQEQRLLAADAERFEIEYSGLREAMGIAESKVKDDGRQQEQLQRQLDRTIESIASSEIELRNTHDQLQALVARYRDDYELVLELKDVSIDEPASNREATEAEIGQLRLDIAAVGLVNMEALKELDDLQGRYDSLNGHYQDLIEAKANLQQIINKIDEDSQRLFTETLEAIRVNFQELYRRSFGGGQADLVLEQTEDMSEAGVEIVATPPGKTAFSNSLLSGGEKALTAVALIMAIFKYRPSPFCILDEVDAPFDEANIGRFVSVLNDFLHMTKFVVVSHSKKTMTAASTIYGVTMQENGVSRQVAVRFEDVKDDSEFLAPKPAKRAA